MALADHEKLFAIAHPKLGREHWVAVDRAIRNAVSWGDLLAINLGTCEYPDLVAEVADLMLAYDRCRWVLCVGRHDGEVFLSIRTSRRFTTLWEGGCVGSCTSRQPRHRCCSGRGESAYALGTQTAIGSQGWQKTLPASSVSQACSQPWALISQRPPKSQVPGGRLSHAGPR